MVAQDAVAGEVRHHPHVNLSLTAVVIAVQFTTYLETIRLQF